MSASMKAYLAANYMSGPKADAIRAAYQAVPAWNDHIMQNQPLKDRLDAMLGTANLSAWSFWCKCPAALIFDHGHS